jgi:hypothetical protein
MQQRPQKRGVGGQSAVSGDVSAVEGKQGEAREGSGLAWPHEMWACPACTLEQSDRSRKCRLCNTMRPDLVELARKLSQPAAPKRKGKAKLCDARLAPEWTPSNPEPRAPKRQMPFYRAPTDANRHIATSAKRSAPPSAGRGGGGGGSHNHLDSGTLLILDAVPVDPEGVGSDGGEGDGRGWSSDSTSDAELNYEPQLPALKFKAVGKAARVRYLARQMENAVHSARLAQLTYARLYVLPMRSRRRSDASARVWATA